MNTNDLLRYILQEQIELQHTVHQLSIAMHPRRTALALLWISDATSATTQMCLVLHFDGALYNAGLTFAGLDRHHADPLALLAKVQAQETRGRAARALNVEAAVQFVMHEPTDLDRVYQHIISDAVQTADAVPWDGNDVTDLAYLHAAEVIKHAQPEGRFPGSAIDMRIAWEQAYTAWSKRQETA